MRRASGFRKSTRVWCIRTLVLVLALTPAVLVTYEDAAAQTSVNLTV